MRRSLMVPLVSVALMCVAGYHISHYLQAQPQTPPPAAPPRSPYGDTLAGSGVVEPQSESISIGTHVAGVVHGVKVRVGDRVRKGDLLFSLDDRQLRAELSVREAALNANQAQLRKLQEMPRPEELPPSEAKVREAESRVTQAEDRFERSRKLLERGTITQEDFIARKQELAAAKEQHQQALKQHELLKAGAWGPDLKLAAANVEQAAAQVRQSETEIDRLSVRAPIDGTILQVKLRPGEYVGQSPGQTYLVIGKIDPLHVRVDIDEYDIPRFRPDLPATAEIRGSEGLRVTLKYVRNEPMVIPKKSLTGGDQERVDTRVMQVIYAVEGETHNLQCGQQVDVFIDLQTKNSRKTLSEPALKELTHAEKQ